MTKLDKDAGRPFEELAWRGICATAARQANAGCGHSHDYYVKLYSATIDSRLGEINDADRQMALQIAREWDYATPEERAETDQLNAENGYCWHGIELGYCPAGCGSA